MPVGLRSCFLFFLSLTISLGGRTQTKLFSQGMESKRVTCRPPLPLYLLPHPEPRPPTRNL
jgi:hypothetical protein